MSVNAVHDSMSYVSYRGKTYIVPTRYAPQDHQVKGFSLNGRQIISMEFCSYLIIDEATGKILKSRFFSPWRTNAEV